MLGFNPKNLRDFSDFRLSAKVVFIVIWNFLILLEFALVLKWDVNNIEKIVREELDIQLKGFIFLALFIGFIATRLALKNEKFQMMVFKPEAKIEDNIDTLKFLSFLLGIMSLAFLAVTVGSNI